MEQSYCRIFKRAMIGVVTFSISIASMINVVSAQSIASTPPFVSPAGKRNINLYNTPVADFPKLQLNSPYWIVVDADATTIIAQNSSDVRIEPASITKVMTAYLIFQALRDGIINENERLKPIKFTEGSRMFLDERKDVSVGELLRGMIIQSGNDASITLAQRIAGTEAQFAKLMNKEAQRLGMKQSNFVNASGLPDINHYTTLKDLAILAIALIRDFPEYYPLYSEKEFTYNNIVQHNRNALLKRNIGADGIKTGHTESAGYCLMASAIRGERRVIVITAKASTEIQRFADAESLIHAAFDSSETVKVYRQEQVVERINVWKGSERDVPIGVSQDLVLMVPKGAGPRLSAKLLYHQPIVAPLTPGQPIGLMVFSLDGKPYVEIPVVALQEVGKASWYRLLWHSIRLWMQ